MLVITRGYWILMTIFSNTRIDYHPLILEWQNWALRPQEAPGSEHRVYPFRCQSHRIHVYMLYMVTWIPSRNTPFMLALIYQIIPAPWIRHGNSIYKKMASSRFLRHQRPSGTPVAVIAVIMWGLTWPTVFSWMSHIVKWPWLIRNDEPKPMVLLRFFRNGHWNHLKSSPKPAQQSQLQTKLSPSVRATFSTASDSLVVASTPRLTAPEAHHGWLCICSEGGSMRGWMSQQKCMMHSVYVEICTIPVFVYILYIYVITCLYTYIWINHNIVNLNIPEIKTFLG